MADDDRCPHCGLTGGEHSGACHHPQISTFEEVMQAGFDLKLNPDGTRAIICQVTETNENDDLIIPIETVAAAAKCNASIVMPSIARMWLRQRTITHFVEEYHHVSKVAKRALVHASIALSIASVTIILTGALLLLRFS